MLTARAFPAGNFSVIGSAVARDPMFHLYGERARPGVAARWRATCRRLSTSAILTSKFSGRLSCGRHEIFATAVERGGQRG